MDNRVLAAVTMRALHDAPSGKIYFESSDRVRKARTLEHRFAKATDVTPTPIEFGCGARPVDDRAPPGGTGEVER